MVLWDPRGVLRGSFPPPLVFPLLCVLCVSCECVSPKVVPSTFGRTNSKLRGSLLGSACALASMDSHLYGSGTAGAGAPDRPSGLYHQQARRKASQRDAKLLETSRFQILSLNNAVLDCTAQNVHCEHAPVVLQATGLQNYMLGDRIVCRSMPTSPTVENNYMLGDRIVCRSTPTYPTAELNITGHRGADVEYRAGSICREQSVRGQVRPAQEEGSAHPPPRRGLAQRNWVGAPAARRTNPPAARFIDAEPAPPQRGLAAQRYWVPGCPPSDGVSVDGVPRDSVLSPADVFNNGRWNLAVGAELCWLLLLGACLCAPELMGRLTRWLIRDERALLSALVVLAASAVPDTAEALLHALLSRSPPPLVQSFAAIHEASAPSPPYSMRSIFSGAQGGSASRSACSAPSAARRAGSSAPPSRPSPSPAAPAAAGASRRRPCTCLAASPSCTRSRRS